MNDNRLSDLSIFLVWDGLWREFCILFFFLSGVRACEGERVYLMWTGLLMYFTLIFLLLLYELVFEAMAH